MKRLLADFLRRGPLSTLPPVVVSLRGAGIALVQFKT